MTKNERDLLNLIRESENQEQAFKTAVAIIAGFVVRHVSSQAPSAGSQQEHA